MVAYGNYVIGIYENTLYYVTEKETGRLIGLSSDMLTAIRIAESKKEEEK